MDLGCAAWMSIFLRVPFQTSGTADLHHFYYHRSYFPQICAVAYIGSKKAFIHLLESGHDANVTSRNGDSPLIFAVKQVFIDIVELLVARKVEINNQGAFGRTAL